MTGVRYTFLMILLASGLYQYTKNGFFLQVGEEMSQKVLIFDILYEGSSVNCTGSSPENRTCHFRNLCYSHSDDLFVYIQGPNSRELFLDMNEVFNAMVLFLTPVSGLDHHLKCINVTREDIQPLAKDINFIFRPGKCIVYQRFVLRNIFHLFHDELLPIFYTLKRHFRTEDTSSIKFFMLDMGDEGEFPFLYDLFSTEPPLFKFDAALEPEGTLTCFEEATVGLVRETTWYQFGFRKPEGPLTNLTLTSEHIKNFTAYLKEKLEINPSCSKENYGIVFSRKSNRRLLNEKELRTAISDQFQVDMVELSLESNSLPYIIEKVSCAKLVVGVHGALLITAMFLPPFSALLEIFPYAINPDHVTHYKTLTQLPGMNISYASWRNEDISKTVTHPRAPPSKGGILYLSEEEQQRIMNVTEVPVNKIGRDSEWLFHFYQDTIVDITAVNDILIRLGFEKRSK